MGQMKKMLLKSIKLQNWSSKSCKAEFGSARNKIMGTNEVGKTTIIAAWRWLLTSRVDAVHPANYEIFDRRYPLTPETPIAVVEAVVEIDGYEYVLTRKAQAHFVKGVKAPSDKYTTLIDNIEYTATQFNEWLSTNICPIENLPFVLDGIFFATLCEEDKKKGRKVLESIVGEITQADFKGDYSIILPMLERLPIEKVLEKANADKKDLEDRVDKIPIEIETKESVLASWGDTSAMESEAEDLKAKIAELDEKINGAVDNKAIEERNRMFAKINSKELSLLECRNTHNAQQYALTSEIKGKISEAKKFNENIEYQNELLREERNRKDRMLRNILNQIQGLRAEREALIKKRDEIKARQFAEHKCSYCGQELPFDILTEMRNKFVEQKQKELDAVVAQGKAVATQIADCEEQVAKLDEELSMPLLLHTPKDISELEKLLKDAEASVIPFENTGEYDVMMREINDLKASLPEVKSEDTSALIREKQDTMLKLEELLKKIGSKDMYNAIQAEIDGLREELRIVGVKVAEKEGEIAKCKEWIEERANIVSNRINDKLQGCSIQMFSIQKNGEQTPDCVILDKNGVKYGKTNTAETLLINIALQKLFMAHYNVELPIFVDECSRFAPSNVPNIQGQHVLIFATDDKCLNITQE